MNKYNNIILWSLTITVILLLTYIASIKQEKSILVKNQQIQAIVDANLFIIFKKLNYTIDSGNITDAKEQISFLLKPLENKVREDSTNLIFDETTRKTITEYLKYNPKPSIK